MKARPKAQPGRGWGRQARRRPHPEVAAAMALEAVDVAARDPGGLAIQPHQGTGIARSHQEEDRLVDMKLHSHPVPAWADAGLARHMSFGGLLPEPEPRCKGKHAVPEVLRPKFKFGLCIFRFLLALISAMENAAAWLAYLEIRKPEANFYNKFEAYALGVPHFDDVLAALAGLTTAYLFFFWVLVVVMRLDFHYLLACGRLVLSTACGILCLIAVFFSEGTKVFPWVCSLCCLLHLQVLCFGGLFRETASIKQRHLCLAGLVAIGFLACGWCLMYSLDGMVVLHEGGCRATKNRAMPVRLAGVDRWQCVTWGQPYYIRRLPAQSEPVFQALCDTPFIVFDEADSTANGTVWNPSQEAHYVQCPPSCQFRAGIHVVGCQVYDARSSMCAAAAQMGLLSSSGGLVKVVGRLVPAAYSRCQSGGVVSADNPGGLPGTALIASRDQGVPADNASAVQQNVTLPGAFYFQEADGMQDSDVVTLHGFRRISTPGQTKPYLSYVAEVSWRIGGNALQQQEVTIGPAEGTEAEVNFCHGAGPAPNNCE